jgi:hypothetical protein
MIRSALIAAAFVMTGASAFAAQTVTANLAQARPAAERVVANGSVWSCSGSTCQAATTGAINVRACKALVSKVGPVTSFGSESRALDADELARCNAAA